MDSRCENYYCDSPNPEMRLPKDQELEFWKNEADEKDLELLDTGQVRLEICNACGTWIAEMFDQSEHTAKRPWIPSPFQFAEGDSLKVILKGKSFGMIGTVIRKGRLAKTIMPPPVPENFYWIVFEEGQREVAFSEKNLVFVF